MTELIYDMDLYKIPSDTVIKNRRAFYSLWRRSDDRTMTWLNRVRNSIRRCEFPKLVEYLLIDRFVCELNRIERDSIRAATSANTWSLGQIIQYFDTILDSTGEIDAYIDENMNFNQDKVTSTVKIEPLDTNEVVPYFNHDEPIEIVKSEPSVCVSPSQDANDFLQNASCNELTDDGKFLGELESYIADVNCPTDAGNSNSFETTDGYFGLNFEIEDDAMQYESEDFKFSVYNSPCKMLNKAENSRTNTYDDVIVLDDDAQSLTTQNRRVVIKEQSTDQTFLNDNDYDVDDDDDNDNVNDEDEDDN